jgi:hypothetical protein
MIAEVLTQSKVETSMPPADGFIANMHSVAKY